MVTAHNDDGTLICTVRGTRTPPHNILQDSIPLKDLLSPIATLLSLDVDDNLSPVTVLRVERGTVSELVFKCAREMSALRLVRSAAAIFGCYALQITTRTHPDKTECSVLVTWSRLARKHGY